MTAKFTVVVTKSAKKDIERIPLPWQYRIIKTISELENDPHYGEKLSGKLGGKRKIQVWPYRIICQVDLKKRLIIILEVGHRQGGY